MRFIAPVVALACAADLDQTLPRCTKTDYTALLTATAATPAYSSCVADMGYTTGQIDFEQIADSATVVNKLVASPNCAALYHSVHSVQSLAPLCLHMLKAISWEMAAAALKTASFPKVSAKCTSDAISAVIRALILDELSYICLDDAGAVLPDFIDDWRLPTLDQIERMRTSTACRVIYDKAETVLATLPHCHVDALRGIDIHIFQVLTYDVFLDWVAFRIRLDTTGQVTSSRFYSVNLAAYLDDAPSVADALFYVATGVFLGLIAVYVADRRKQGYQPIRDAAVSLV